MRKMKKGVSLVTVLLFMMVATIAATATYKWVSSIGSSSAARLQVSEARQAALSGIEAARSWMTFNGNDLGAVIKQYFENGKQPILLNSILPKIRSGKVRDSVWLMGVNVENTSKYRVKIVSLGTTRENVKYSEVAIFNVNGLYQVEIPTEERSVNYKDAFHGGLATADLVEVTSAFIKQTPAVTSTGGQALNTVHSSEYLVLDGSFYVQNRGDVRDLYVTGDLSFGNNLNVSGNMYVGSKIYGTSVNSRMSVSGSSYLNGGMKVNNRSSYALGIPGVAGSVTGGKFDFYGNVTSNGDIDHFTGNTGVSYIKMHENLVLNGKLVFPTTTTSKRDSIRVMHNAFIRDNSTNSGNVGFDFMPKTFFGTSTDDKLYLAQFGNYSDGNVCGGVFKCAKSSNDKIYIAYKGNLITTPLPEEYADWNADSLVVYRNMISADRYPDCGFSKDRIQFNTGILSSSLLHSASARFGCSEDIWKNDIDFPVAALNSCYNTANNNDQLLDKTWLVVKWDHAPKWNSTEEKLTGNFIFIIDASSTPLAKLELPETESDTKVMLYLPSGWKNETSSYALTTNPNKANAVYNYFIYSVDNIGRFNTRSGTPLRGSVYMQGCAQLNTLPAKDTLVVSFSETLLRGLVKSSIICEYDGTNICSGFSGSSSEFEGVDQFQTVDPYHITTSPQLIVEIESQYRNSEPLPQSAQAYDTIAPSEIVLPRVVYLPRDAKGHLYDYYNVIGLNGARSEKVASKMHCPSAIPTGNSKLTSGGNLAEGKYLCSYGGDKDANIPVYVVVEGSLSENAEVHFHPDDENREINAGGSADVRLVTTASNSQMSLDIMVPNHPQNGWSVEPIHPNLNIKNVDNGWKIYTLTTTPTGDDIPVFRVSATENAVLGGVDLHLKVCDKCIIRSPTQAFVHITNRVLVEREEINCGDLSEGERGDFKQAYGFECSDLHSIPDCAPFSEDSLAWVSARGLGCFPIEKNNKWNCYTGGNSVYLDSITSGTSLCMAYIPPKSVELKSYGNIYKLPAEHKRKRDTLVVKIEGVNKGSVKVDYKRLLNTGLSTNSMTCSDDVCKYALFAGDTVSFSKEGGSSRLYWTCNGKSCAGFKPDEQISAQNPEFTLVGGRDSITAWFGQKDAHCFYTNFEDFKKNGWCTENDIANEVHCIDKCKSGTNCSVSQENYGGAVRNSDWLMVYSNDGNSYKMPQIGSGRMKHPEGFGRRVILKEQTGNPTVLLSRVLAGSNGMMTAMVNIPSAGAEIITRIEELLDNPLLSWLKNLFGIKELLINDGLIIRSNANASEYFTLNIIAHEPVVYARLCYVQGQKNSLGNCHDIPFKTGFNDNWAETANRLTRLTLNVDVDGSKIKVILSKNYLQGTVESGLASVEFDLDSPTLKSKFKNKTLNDDAHQYVGVKIDVPYVIKYNGIFIDIDYTFKSFEVFDIGWRSYDYDENCWDTPKVSCSFKPRYTGGMVPDSTDVTPWVGMSSWFEGKHCKVTYYYNGCDLDEDHYAFHFRILRNQVYSGNEIACRLRRPHGLGLYNFSGRKLETYGLGRLNSDKYWFEDEGYHGYPVTTSKASGFVNEASVVVSCIRDAENNNSHIYDASCGDFIVGEYKQCDESYPEMLSFPKNCYATDGSCFVELDTIFNVREATLSFALDAPTASLINAYLVDVDSNLSTLDVEKIGDTEYQINVESVSDAPGFNPQNLRGILFKNVTNHFTVNRVWSHCRHAFNVECKGSNYNFSTKTWTVSASVVHPERAETCEIVLLEDGNEVHGADVPDPQACGEDFMQTFEQDGIYGQFTSRSYAFKVVAKDVQGNVMDECQTVPTVIDPIEISCWLTADTVEQGFGVPMFEFDISNCPPEGCPYTITYPADFDVDQEVGVYIPGDHYQNCPPNPKGSGRSCSAINSEQEKLVAKNAYEYKLDVMGHSCPFGSNEFYVAPEPEKGTCNDHKIEDGYFVAHIGFAQDGYWKGSIAGSARIVYTDMIGNVIDVENQHIGTNALHKDSTQVFGSENLKAEDAELRYKLPESMFKCSKGVCTYLVTLLLYGGDYCSEQWKVRAMSNLNSNCPSIDNQDPTTDVSFRPIMSGCEDDTVCVWSVWKNGTRIGGGSGYNGTSTLTFSDYGSVGTKTYRFKVSANDEYTTALDSCDFNVTYTNDGLSVENCGFTNTTEWGGIAKYTFRTNCAGCSYDLRSPTGVGYSGTTNSLENDATNVEFTVSKAETFDLTVNGKKIDECSDKIPVMGTIPASCDIGNNVTKLYSDQKAMFTATFGTCSDGSCKWPWVLKKNNGEIYSGEVQSNGTIQKEITGGGTYALFLNGSDAAACTIEITDEGMAPTGIGNCKFEQDEYAFGATGIKFMASGIYANNETWTIKKVGSNVTIGSGKFDAVYQEQSLNYMFSNFTANSQNAGSYELKLSPSDNSCIAELKVNVPTKMLTCEKRGTKIYVVASGCDYGCSAKYQRIGSSNQHPFTIRDSYEFSINSSNNYKVFFEDGPNDAVSCNVPPRSMTCLQNGKNLSVKATGCDYECDAYYQENNSSNTSKPFKIKVDKNLSVSNNKRYQVYFAGESDNLVPCENNGPSYSLTCTRKREWSRSEGWTYYLSLTATGCDYGCTYVVKGEAEDSPSNSINNQSVVFRGFSIGSGGNKRSYIVDGSTQYSVSLNGGSAYPCTNGY